ncbi:RING-type domain-containing protein [Chloropicon primus]|uniref:RING-type domain-containing protein n=1 Tax=Chloropicon primus TaxID=1764295 RepID=A0A5B8MF61_9CHLO|nr:hypothetical protein A3770_02p13220 [Chloropicon primus]UPQ98011.1 RING-type domain-containing protein [Chloropicon primus]|eukprot:QDZ18804.1 hypothetical protein A3770_02p13220 [Chloropicon primus]
MPLYDADEALLSDLNRITRQTKDRLRSLAVENEKNEALWRRERRTLKERIQRLDRDIERVNYEMLSEKARLLTKISELSFANQNRKAELVEMKLALRLSREELLRNKTEKKRQTVLRDSSCCICIKHMREPAALPCGHVFCASCLRTALSTKMECPMCRKAVASANKVIKLFF